MENVALVVNFIVAGVAIALSIIAMLLAGRDSSEAKVSLEKARDTMSKMEMKIGGIEEVIKGQIKEAWDVFLKQARGEGKIPGEAQLRDMSQMVNFFKDMGMEAEIKKMMGDALRKGLRGSK